MLIALLPMTPETAQLSIYKTQMTLAEGIVSWSILLIFWYGFCSAIFESQNFMMQMIFTIICSQGQMLVPFRFGFTYVQTAIIFLFTISLFFGKKDIY